mgnify:CR=1 FL=1
MDGATVAAWVGVGALSLTSIGGWLIAFVRNSKAQAQKFGQLEGKVDSLTSGFIALQTSLMSEVASLHGRMSGIESRLDSRINPSQ